MQHNYQPQPPPAGDDLAAQVERLAAQVAQLTAALTAMAKDAPHPYGNVVIHEKRVHDFMSNLAQPRRVIDYRTTNRTTGTTITADGYSAGQLERAARKFARLDTPSRAYWHGDKALYGLMRRMFAEHGGIVQHHGSQCWRWAAWPHVRREIAARIAASFVRP